MFLKKIEIKNFRNISEQRVNFSKNVTLLLGENGVGKTNFVEAIYFLSNKKSFRENTTKHLINKQNHTALIRGELFKDETTNEIKVKIDEDKITTSLNEKATGTNKLKTFFPLILFSPESLLIIKEGPEKRRDILDETSLITEKENIKAISEFNKIHKTKSTILRQYKKKELSEKKAREMLEILNELFFQKSVNLIKNRLQTIEKIDPIFKDVFKEMTGQNVDISLEYVISGERQKDIDKISNTLRNNLVEKQTFELSTGACLVGPHKHDMQFIYDRKIARNYCSQGQQRTLILAFKMSQILYHEHLYGYYPILVLDDVLSELDSSRKEFLLKFLASSKAQTFITATDTHGLSFWNDMEIEKLEVTEGQIVNRRA